jgi:hypothetical protein
MYFIRAALCTAAMLAFTSGAQASIIYNSITAATGGGASIAGVGPLYNSFSTDSSGLLSRLELRLGLTGTANPNGAVDVAIYSDATNDIPAQPTPGPGDLVLDIGLISDSQGPLVAFSSAVELGPLAPNTRYWIGLVDQSSIGVTSLDWERAPDASGFGVGGEFSQDGFAQTPNGSPFEMCLSNGSAACSLTGVTTRIDLSAAAVPEPASLSILGIGLVGLAAGGMKRNKMHRAPPPRP